MNASPSLHFSSPAGVGGAAADGPDRPCCIVGIGASAGGLEALETFFDNVPEETGLAFVVVQHLSPDFKSLMDELLSRHTKLRIHRVSDGMVVEPNAIYLIPPKKEMIVSGGRLLLTDKDPADGLALPIDIFFRSLAQDVGGRAVGVVLSGTGSDGSRGIRAIHEAGGLVVAQDIETAKFDGMPKSAVDTGVVDFVLPPAAMAETILRYARHPADRGLPEGVAETPVTEEGVSAIFRILRDEYSIDFSHYKPSTVGRRIQRRLQLVQSYDLEEYVARLRADPQELNLLYRDLLIGVTKFFRDPEAFNRLGQEIIPQLVERTKKTEELRVWVAGCGTGEEAYSLAILIHEVLGAASSAASVKIFATDVHRASLDFASAGRYDEVCLTEVAPERLNRYFTKRGTHYQVSQDLRKMIVFAPHNVIKDAPFTKLDLISCRNLLIYLQPLAQKKAISLFHFGLKAGGVLFLGPSETPGEIAEEFESIDVRWKLFRKRRDVRLPADMRLPLSAGHVNLRSAGGLVPALPAVHSDLEIARAYDVLLERFVPTSMLVDEHRNVLHTFGGAGRFLSPRDGRMSADVLDLVGRELKMVLAGSLQRAAKELKPVRYTGVVVQTAEGREEINVSVEPVFKRKDSAAYMLISLESTRVCVADETKREEVDLQAASREQVDSLELELQYTKENLQATVEELETSNEELQATNEELVASNEELQSTNEELHSVNEELYTVNAEHQRKIAELSQLTNDMDNLLASIDVGTLFLDADLCIRKFTPRAAEIFHVLAQDIGRRIDNFTYTIEHPGLLADIKQVLATKLPLEKQVQDHHGDWQLLRILPYRSHDSVDGVVVTLIDVSTLKRVERELRLMSKVFEDNSDPVVIEDLAGRVIDLNREAERVYGFARDELLGQCVDLLLPPEHRQESNARRERCIAGEAVRNIETVRVTKSGQQYPVLLTLSLLTDEQSRPVAIASIAKNITVQKNAEMKAREAVRRRDEFLAILSHELRNPLGAVLNATYVLGREFGDVAAARGPREVIRRQTEQMARLLDDLLDVSRVTQDRIDIRKEVFDLRDAVKLAVEAVRSQVEGRKQEFTVDVSDEPLFVNGDPSRLQQIQVNLLANAVKYTPPGGRIWLRATADQGDVVIQVCDSGEGIPAEMLDGIFDLFVQANRTLDHSDGGMGVGLTLVRKLVELHGGQVAAHSDGPGKGSRFTVRLPAVERPEAIAHLANDEAGQERPVRILVIEDNADSREMLKSLLELNGHQVTVAADGRAGLASLEQNDYDVAFVDIGLPEMDGYEVARKAREGQKCPSTKLIALTGYGRSSDRQAVHDAGFDEHLVKPLKLDELGRVLKRLKVT